MRQNLLMGYSQLYPAFVIFQFCLIFPLLLKLLPHAPPRTDHGVEPRLRPRLGRDAALPSLVPRASDGENALSSVVPWSRDLLTYQEFFVAGALVALHFDQVCAFVAGHTRRIFVLSGVIGGLMILWYAVQVNIGTSLLPASTPIGRGGALVLRRHRGDVRGEPGGTPGPRGRRAHTVQLDHVGRSGSVHRRRVAVAQPLPHEPAHGSRGHGPEVQPPWEATIGILFVGIVLISGRFVSLVLRTRLRWVLGGPAAPSSGTSTTPCTPTLQRGATSRPARTQAGRPGDLCPKRDESLPTGPTDPSSATATPSVEWAQNVQLGNVPNV